MRRALTVGWLLSLWTIGVAAGSDVGDLYEKVKRSVVVIETTETAVDPTRNSGLTSLEGMGSGVLISDDGKVLTAAHVVQVAHDIVVRFLNDESIPARVLASDPAADLALLQLERLPIDAQVATLGDSSLANVGDKVFVVGAPLGWEHTLTVGHVSALRRYALEEGTQLQVDQIQTDAAVNHGNSGGPMFDMKGRVIGIVSYMISQGEGFEGLGFAITSNMARQLLLDKRSLWSGMQLRFLTGDLARMLNVPQTSALLVETVAQRSLGHAMGLVGGATIATVGDEKLVLGGDIILECLDVSLGDPDFRRKIRARLEQLQDGDEIVIHVLRAGRTVKLRQRFDTGLLVPPAPQP